MDCRGCYISHPRVNPGRLRLFCWRTLQNRPRIPFIKPGILPKIAGLIQTKSQLNYAIKLAQLEKIPS